MYDTKKKKEVIKSDAQLFAKDNFNETIYV